MTLFQLISFLSQVNTLVFDDNSAGRLTQAEEIRTGKVDWVVNKTYFQATGLWSLILSALLFLLSQVCSRCSVLNSERDPCL